jgi:hypothetical protein
VQLSREGCVQVTGFVRGVVKYEFAINKVLSHFWISNFVQVGSDEKSGSRSAFGLEKKSQKGGVKVPNVN